jgi:hypothetical protein
MFDATVVIPPDLMERIEGNEIMQENVEGKSV